MLLLVDFENVKDVDLALLPSSTLVRIFVGRSQKTVPISLASQAQRFKGNLEWMEIAGDGKNNLDFHLAYHLGRLAIQFPSEKFVILSKDKGFDSLIAHLKLGKISCRRVEALAELAGESIAPENPNFKKARDVLSKTACDNRPGTRKTLTQHISAMFQKKLPPSEIEGIVNAFLKKGLITEIEGKLSYTF